MTLGTWAPKTPLPFPKTTEPHPAARAAPPAPPLDNRVDHPSTECGVLLMSPAMQWQAMHSNGPYVEHPATYCNAFRMSCEMQ